MVFPSIGEFWCTQTYVLRPLVFLIKVKAKIMIGIMIAGTDMLVHNFSAFRLANVATMFSNALLVKN